MRKESSVNPDTDIIEYFNKKKFAKANIFLLTKRIISFRINTEDKKSVYIKTV